MKKIIMLITACLLLNSSCNKENTNLETVDNIILDFAQNNNLDVQISILNENSLKFNNLNELKTFLVETKLLIDETSIIYSSKSSNSYLKGAPCPNLDGMKEARIQIIPDLHGVGLLNALQNSINPQLDLSFIFDNGSLIDWSGHLSNNMIFLNYEPEMYHVTQDNDGNTTIETSGIITFNISYENYYWNFNQTLNATVVFDCNI